MCGYVKSFQKTHPGGGDLAKSPVCDNTVPAGNVAVTVLSPCPISFTGIPRHESPSFKVLPMSRAVNWRRVHGLDMFRFL